MSLHHLWPCPFCGCRAWMHEGPAFPDARGFRVECEGACHAMTCWWHTETEAAAAWNKRSLPECYHCKKPIEGLVYRCTDCDGTYHKHCMAPHATNWRPLHNPADPERKMLEAKIERQRKVIEDYAVHQSPACRELPASETGFCYCGLTAAIKEAVSPENGKAEHQT